MDFPKNLDGERLKLKRNAQDATKIYLLFVFAWLLSKALSSGGIGFIYEMKANEVGDLFAGLAGPFALIWIVYGYFLQELAIRQQGEELHQNTKMLELQKDAIREQVNELRDSVSQQTQLVGLNRELLELEREKIKAERDNLRASFAPALVVSIFDRQGMVTRSRSHMEADKKINVDISNKGGAAFDILFISKEKGISCDPDAIQIIGKGSSFTACLTIEKGHKFHEAEIDIEYFDALREKHSRRYYLFILEDKVGGLQYKLRVHNYSRADEVL